VRRRNEGSRLGCMIVYLLESDDRLVGSFSRLVSWGRARKLVELEVPVPEMEVPVACLT
jgi:hypothetical protein